MYSGFITPKTTVTRVGIHQRFDMAAYKMIKPYLSETTFPTIKQIVHFEGYNGPDGLKVKSRGKDQPSHLYDPLTGTGEMLLHIKAHYDGLVQSIKHNDAIRAAFEAAWMAHYLGDGLTPAHHWPLEQKLAEAALKASKNLKGGDTGRFAAAVKKNWALWGAKGHLSTHFNFEMGIAFAFLVFPIKPEFSEHELVQARQLGPIEYFKAEARKVAELNLYEQFYRKGWTNELAVAIKTQVAPRAARTIGLIWLLALLDAGQQLATQAHIIGPGPDPDRSSDAEGRP